MPKLFGLKSVTALLAITCLVGCETAKSANPTAPSVAGPIPGVNITAPKPLEPYSGSTLTFTGEPQTLLIENAGTSGARALYLQLEVATDDQFRSLVFQADRISLGPDGRTSYQLPSPLGAGYTYYWHTRAVDGANSGPYSATYNFAVVPPVTIDPPFAQAPSGTVTGSNKPEFKAVNGAIFHTTGVTYRFEVAKDAGFTQLVAVVTVPVNGSGTTSMTIGELPYKTTFYWRVRGSDGTKESNYSNTASFTIAEPTPVAPPPGQTPTASVDASQWTTAQWKDYFLALAAQKGGPYVSDAGMKAMRNDLVARGADWQNGWRGDMRPRIFLPVPGCPPASSGGNVPPCTFNKTVDVGMYGEPWQWIPRF